MKRIFVIILLLTLFNVESFAQQKSQKDSIYHVLIVGLHLEGQTPDGDMAKRFGYSMSTGVPVFYKTSKNILFGIENNYFFSTNVKEHTLTNLYTPELTITDINGNPGGIRFNERGWNIYAMVGGIINKLGHNKNSGLMILAGGGWMQHRIAMYDVGKNIPQIHGKLAHGYDRLTGGPSANQFIGYMYMSQNKIANFYFGFEFQEGFTTGLRGYQFDLMAKDDQKRLDLLYGFRFGWLLPLYKRAPKEFYYY